MQELIKSLIPVKTELIWGGITGGTGTLVTFLFGAWSDALTALGMFMLIDYISGVMAAYMRPKAKLSSKRGLQGLVKKLALAMLVVFAHYLDVAVGQHVFMTLAVYVLLGNEGLSIIENLSYCGAPVPASIKDKLEQLAHEKSERGGSDGTKKSQ